MLYAGVVALVPSTLFLFVVNAAVPDVVFPLSGIETTDPGPSGGFGGGYAFPGSASVTVRRAVVRYPPVVGTLVPLLVGVAAQNAASETDQRRSLGGLSPRSSAAVASTVSLSHSVSVSSGLESRRCGAPSRAPGSRSRSAP